MLSDKKYIQSRARSLPIYKCFVNPDWKIAKMANVFVLRMHINGNITAGVYLIDLLCLGVKDTFFMFNEPIDIVMDKLYTVIDDPLEIDYNTAHNIVFASHDFAFDYHIKPHHGFEISKFILEEDNDEIPIIDIEVGSFEGIPHLVVQQKGMYLTALSSLKKYAGEGNYYYTIGEQLFNESVNADKEIYDDEEDDDYDEGDEVEEMFYSCLDDFEKGTLSPIDVGFISTEELLDEEKVKEREEFEKSTILVELAIRSLYTIYPLFLHDNHIDIDNDLNLASIAPDFPIGVSDSEIDNFSFAVSNFFDQMIEPNNNGDFQKEFEMITRNLINQFQDNILVISFFYEFSILTEFEWCTTMAESKLKILSDRFSFATMMLGFGNNIKKISEGKMNTQILPFKLDLNKFYPGVSEWSKLELYVAWLEFTLISFQRNDFRNAIHYYLLAAGLNIRNRLFLIVQQFFIVAIERKLVQGNLDS